MTRVDFYILPDASDEARLRLACRLADKAVQQKLDVFVLAETETDVRMLDKLLWTFSQNSFLPHRYAWDLEAGRSEEPVVIGCRDRADTETIEDGTDPAWDLMINLGSEIPTNFSRYQRLAEVVDAEPTRRDDGRIRYRYYRDRGYELQTHQL